MNPFLRISFLTWKNRIWRGGLRAKATLIATGVFLAGFSLVLFRMARFAAQNDAEHIDFVQMSSGIHVGFLAVFFMLLMSNFACALAAFFGAQDIPLILGLPISRRRFFLGRGLVSIWNASWSALFFVIPLFFGLLAGRGVDLLGFAFATVALALFLLTVGTLGIFLAVLFVNVVPMGRLLEFLAVVLTVVILLLSAFAPHTSDAPFSIRALGAGLFSYSATPVQFFPPVALSRVFSSVLEGKCEMLPLLSLVAWGLGGLVLTDRFFDQLFMRGWNAAFGSARREKVVRVVVASRKRLPLVDPQVRSILTKERRMFLRDASQVVQLFVILLLTFLYLFNLKNLRLLSFAAEEGSHWWQGVLGLANISMGGCVAAAVATRFVFPSVSLEGRAYYLLRATPLSLPKLLAAKCFAWFFPVAAVMTTLFVAGAMTLQLPLLALFHTLVISIALSVGLVGLGVGMGAVYAKFDWDHTSSLHSGFGSLLFMLLAFVLILATLLPAGFLYFISCVPSFAENFGNLLIPSSLTLMIIVGMNFMVARGALMSGVQRLIELEQ